MSDRMELEIAHFLEQVGTDHLSDETKQKIRQMMREVGELESIADACYNIARIIHRRDQTGKKFTSQQVNDLQAMMALCEEALDKMFTIVDGENEEDNIDETMRVEKCINAMRDRLRTENVEAVNKHSYDYTLGTLFDDIVGELERLGDYVVNVVEAKIGK